ncbi:hypothetical protein [Candidatus Chloroploca sp. Khr17]|uniref:hypothetical protein n=1 Tax=Candidatus Chloroploca sp. Khr17 TaxID=2496869 RepID=UPI00101BEB10|nr:hypothetical protein [Candidatus Chloroploca sp. Khr17]
MNTTAETQLYTLRFSGSPEATFLADYCPVGTTLTIEQHTFTLANLRTDQAGLIGLIRSLHNLGCTLTSLATDSGEDK